MPTDFNDKESVKQFIMKARNEGHSDDEIVDYIKTRRASSAGSTLQAWGQRAQEQSPVTTPISGRPSSQTPLSLKSEREGERVGRGVVEGFLFPGPLNLVSEGIEKGISVAQGHPEEGPTLKGALARTAVSMAIPKVFQTAASIISPAARISKEVVKDTMQAGVGVLRKPAAMAETQLGNRVAQSVGRESGILHPLTPIRDRILSDAEAAGGQLMPQEVQGLLGQLRNAFPGKITSKYTAAQKQLNTIADNLANETASGANPIGVFRLKEIVREFQEKGFQEAGSAQASKFLAFAQRPLKNKITAEVARTLGPDAANTYSSIETQIGARAQALKGGRAIARVPRGAEGSQGAIVGNRLRNVLDPQDAKGQLLQQFEKETGIPLYQEARRLALKRAWNPSDAKRADWMSTIATRFMGTTIGSALGGAEHQGLGAVLGFLLADPRLARPTAKFLVTMALHAQRPATAAMQGAKGEFEDLTQQVGEK